MEPGFAIMKLHQRKKWVWPWARGAAQICGSPLIFLLRLKVATLRLGGRWALPSPITKFYPEEQVGVVIWAEGAPQICGSPLIFLQRLKVPTSRLAGKWALPRPNTKSHPEENVGRGHKLGELPKM